ncbi:MAG TPA: 3-phosphoshikimate 1-carboxyvinyltransferase [Gemmatimonadaceae bacterium]|nr:3-phosphoshikimate 1-carboxyvinyltransferase [Gemmatimonadaceae bacterium]
MNVGGIVHVPGDKSISHRALILAALANGTSHLTDILQSADVESTARVLRALGAPIPPLAAQMEIAGRGRRGLTAPAADLDCGNSGTTARLVAGVVAGHPFRARFTGDASLSRRPMKRIARPLEAMGAAFTFEGSDGLPMTVQGGALRALRWESEVASAQVKSAVLLAGLVAGVPIVVREPARSRDHTERMLRAMGAEVDSVGEVVRLEPVDHLGPLALRIPGDPSSAAFLAALAVLATGGAITVPDLCVNPTRLGFYRAMQRMGAHIDFHVGAPQGGEEIGTLFAWPSTLHAAEFGGAEVPAMIDEIPLLACVASRVPGTTVIRGASELRVKESDRIAAVVANLRAVGVAAEELPDGLTVTGGDAPLAGAVRTHGDHRLAMAFGVLAALPGSRIAIDDPGCVAVSYPAFWDDVRAAVSA